MVNKIDKFLFSVKLFSYNIQPKVYKYKKNVLSCCKHIIDSSLPDLFFSSSFIDDLKFYLKRVKFNDRDTDIYTTSLWIIHSTIIYVFDNDIHDFAHSLMDLSLPDYIKIFRYSNDTLHQISELSDSEYEKNNEDFNNILEHIEYSKNLYWF